MLPNVNFAKAEKAQIFPIKADKSLDKPIPCLFNPKEYTLKKTNKWSPQKSRGKDVPEFQFTGGNPASLSLQLLFDTFESGDDVCRKYTDALWKLMMIDPNLTDRVSKGGRPPLVRFVWGEKQSWSFDAAIMSMTQKLTLFSDSGTPLRATVDVDLQEVLDPLDYAPQNPTSGSLFSGRQWTVREGDSLQSIAYAEYGDCNRWRAIADANRLVQVRRLRVGTLLEIPDVV